MAYFECISGGAGGGATITVTYDSSFYNKTITCSNGTKTYTKTTTSSGSTEFSVSDEGTWTITCNGVSRTVNVVLNYTTQMVITKTITVYSAANDTVSFTDSAGSKTVTTNSSGQGSVNITFIPPSVNITFTSSVAKNPDNLSANYSKTVTVTSSTTSVYVMPDGALYWYGWISSNIEDITSANGWSLSGYTLISPTHSTNKITLSALTNQLSGIGSKNKVTGTISYITQGITMHNNYYGYLASEDSKSMSLTFSTLTPITSDTISKYSKIANNQYAVIETDTIRTIDIYAIFSE